MSHDLLTPIPVPARQAVVVRVRDLFLQGKSIFKAWRNRREAMVTLAGMDGRMLKDIGLHESDVRSALAEPLWSDPTIRLKLVVVERRASARAKAREDLQWMAASDSVPPATEMTNRPRAEGLKTAC
ncbi:hypothetical protein GCM10007276_10020 [Agaricicola taiwanensis]|uniref:YjiS-like domain-containing protein n=1 Tax=Agaricicola taiwanensis TaxID=591372 RepID=A0A8J2VNT4_9RHOB|nr:DUF1127 domain-containing protein [Agaricicola taiwanensis]GGE34604.1 hypothetical protein GCM10007276_10020 [Agaricicola taiwanensis]